MAGAQSIKGGDQTGRLGVMYVRSLLAQAGVANTESSPGEDHLAVDVTISTPQGATVGVQVKCGTKKQNKDGSISVPVTDKWKKKWAASCLPVFLVYVHLDRSAPGEWIEHGDGHTLVHAQALWSSVNAVKGNSVRLPVKNRLTAATFDTWVDEFEQAWGKAASA